MGSSLKNYIISIKFDVNKTPLTQINGVVNDITSKASAAGAKVEKSVNSTLTHVNKSAGGALGALSGYLKGMAGLFAGHEMIKAADEYAKALGRIKLYASDTQLALNKVYANAQKSGTSFVSQAELVGSVMQNQKHIGLNESQSIQLADTFGKALSMTSQGAAQDNAAILQFVQMMGAEKVTNMDLKPLLHDSAAISKYLTEISGMSATALMELAGKGSLSPKQVIGWLLEATDRVNQDFEKMPKTFGQGFQRINNAVVKFIGELNQASGISTVFYKVVGKIADHFGRIVWLAALLVASWRLQLFFMRQGVEQSKAMALWEGIRARFTKASLVASAKHIAGMAKMAAMLYGVMLLVDDFYGWLNGKDSVFGDIFGSPDEVKATLKPLTDAFKMMSGWLQKLGVNAGTLGAFSGIGAVAYTLLKVFRLLAEGIGQVALMANRFLVPALLSVSRAAMAALLPLLANPITWIILAIVAALAAVWYYWDDIKKATLAAWEATKTAWGTFSAWFSALWDEAVNAVADKWEGFKSAASVLGDSLKSTFKGYVDDIADFFQNLPERIKGWIAQIGTYISHKASEWAKMLNPASWFGGDTPDATAAKIAGHANNSISTTHNWNPNLVQHVNISGAATPAATGRAVMGATRTGWNATYPGLPNAEASY
ncbi:hypothetical protein SGGMMB4_01634 [Sodalis glossinidius str. 'morsitans']|uniref:Tape measure protein N-terminal domain-containing protein n=1 Tax=Sodalis glossinidius (strain morsitans) TaxID=343509 RepID=A0A193QHW0_SODGM|nr:tape measure protein [Sodalis glossinidius]CRL44505.1 hypothetical protein SGGMMB4_01634 [Sodalis glossinidius str. 'morsitans']